LARDAQRAAILFGDINGLHILAVGEAEQPFARPVHGDLFRNNPRPVERIACPEGGAQILGHIGHDLERSRPAHIEPAPELVDAHAQLPLRDAGLRKPIR
jgi:hypothetical protein